MDNKDNVNEIENMSDLDNSEKYEVYRTTDFNAYTIVVEDDDENERSHLYLYVGEPVNVSFFGLYEDKKEPVRHGTVDYTDDINYGIYQLIADYELRLWQKYKAKTGETYLEIDYEKEIRRRERLSNKQSTTLEWETTPTTFKDYQDETTYVLTASGKKMNYNSYRNLKQNQHLKKYG